jgi:A/G-specific adenine glycosylase
LCFGERVAILDGNVKRVLTRFLGFDADLAQARHERQLWEAATALLPSAEQPGDMARYTQGMMDLGATVCTTKRPNCHACPLADRCKAHALGTPERFPVKTRKLKRTSESLWMLWAVDDQGALWLSQRPTPGVWAGLYCFDLYADRAALVAAVPAHFQAALHDMPVFKHVLTHKDLHLHPVQLTLPKPVRMGVAGQWFSADEWLKLGLPAPIKKLLNPVV